jgi:FKBP-type peptidyl-prolyl cis-trans isomerase 2
LDRKIVNTKIRLLFFAGVLLLIMAATSNLFLKAVKEGDTVKINYTLMLDNGTIYYTTIGNTPVRVKLGEGVLLPALEKELVGMQKGEIKAVTIPVEQAYGPYRADLIQVVARDQLPAGTQPVVGERFDAQLLDGSPTRAVVSAVTDKTVTLEANHPLAGQNLNFSIELVSIENGISPTQTQMILGLALLVIGVGAARITFFQVRNRKKGRVTRWLGIPRRLAPAGHRKR